MPPTVTEPLVKTVRVIPPTIVIDQTSTVKRQLRTAAYCRVSTDSDEQELSFEAQVAAYTDKIMSNPEWSLVGIFADEGISGTQADKRKDFMRMIRMCRKGKIDQIITKSVSRFARNTVDCLNYVRELKQLGIPVIFEKEGLNTMHMTSEIYISMHGIFAQSESESLSGNVKWGKQKSAEKGNVAISYKKLPRLSKRCRRKTQNRPRRSRNGRDDIRLVPRRRQHPHYQIQTRSRRQTLADRKDHVERVYHTLNTHQRKVQGRCTPLQDLYRQLHHKGEQEEHRPSSILCH